MIQHSLVGNRGQQSESQVTNHFFKNVVTIVLGSSQELVEAGCCRRSSCDGHSFVSMFFPRTYDLMAIWSAMPTCFLAVGAGGAAAAWTVFLGGGSWSVPRVSSNLGALIGTVGIVSSRLT